MKKNNKGFFLAETIIIIALVTTVMAFVYPNVSKLYENYKLQVKYYDQPEDIYALKAAYRENKDSINSKTNGKSDGCSIAMDGGRIFSNNEWAEITLSLSDIDITELYISGYMADFNNKTGNFNFDRYLKRMKKTTTDRPSYRLIGVFGTGDKTRYASIKIENPNSSRECNL